MQRADRLQCLVDQLEADDAVSWIDFRSEVSGGALELALAGFYVWAIVAYAAGWEAAVRPYLPAGLGVLLDWQVLQALAIAALLSKLLRVVEACTAAFDAIGEKKLRLDIARRQLAEELDQNM